MESKFDNYIHKIIPKLNFVKLSENLINNEVKSKFNKLQLKQILINYEKLEIIF